MSNAKDDFERLIADAPTDLSISAERREELRKHVLVAYDSSQAEPWPVVLIFFIQSFWRWVMARPIPRIGIPVFALVLLSSGLFFLTPAKQGFAFEDLIEPLLNAKTCRCKMIVKMKDLPAFTFEAMFRDMQSRQMSKDMGTVSIHDDSKGISLWLNTNEKNARILQQINRDPEKAAKSGFLQTIREQLLAIRKDDRIEKRESLGERELGGRKLVGYRISSPGNQIDLWGDQETGLPHTIVSDMAAFPNMEITITDFEFDIVLDDSLFSLVPPAGYSVTRDTMDMSLISEAGFISALKQFAEINSGAYPDEINMIEGFKLLKEYKDKLTDKTEDEQEQEINRVRKIFAGGFAFPLQLAWETDAAYAGKGMNREAGQKPIFWYKPKGSEKYRVILADLTTIDSEEPPQANPVQRFAQEASATSEAE